MCRILIIIGSIDSLCMDGTDTPNGLNNSNVEGSRGGSAKIMKTRQYTRMKSCIHPVLYMGLGYTCYYCCLTCIQNYNHCLMILAWDLFYTCRYES